VPRLFGGPKIQNVHYFNVSISHTTLKTPASEILLKYFDRPVQFGFCRSLLKYKTYFNNDKFKQNETRDQRSEFFYSGLIISIRPRGANRATVWNRDTATRSALGIQTAEIYF
jgi:hypothetical protein